MPLKNIIQETRQRMDRSLEHFDRELRGIRTGRATTALIEYVKVDYYGSPTELRELAAISVVDPTQLLVKPFDPSAKAGIVKAIETADLGLNPMTDGEVIRIAVPAPSGERRKQLTELVVRAVTEAYHLGFSAEEVREALEKGLRQVRFPERRRRKG